MAQKEVSSRIRHRLRDLPASDQEPKRKEQFHEREDNEKPQMGAWIKLGSQAGRDPA
jgi:hypothetical protein